MSENRKEFYTVRGYALQSQEDLTPSMEDYLEMAFRLTRDKGYTRIGDLADGLNVQPPSASKMVQKLSEMGYLKYEKYGVIELTDQGRELGTYLLSRHKTVEQFLTIIGVTKNVLEDTEKIEHNISEETLHCFDLFVKFIQQNEKWMQAFVLFKTVSEKKGGDSPGAKVKIT